MDTIMYSKYFPDNPENLHSFFLLIKAYQSFWFLTILIFIVMLDYKSVSTAGILIWQSFQNIVWSHCTWNSFVKQEESINILYNSIMETNPTAVMSTRYLPNKEIKKEICCRTKDLHVSSVTEFGPHKFALY